LFGHKQIDLHSFNINDILQFTSPKPSLPWGDWKWLIVVYKCNGFRWIFEAYYDDNNNYIPDGLDWNVKGIAQV